MYGERKRRRLLHVIDLLYFFFLNQFGIFSNEHRHRNNPRSNPNRNGLPIPSISTFSVFTLVFFRFKKFVVAVKSRCTNDTETCERMARNAKTPVVFRLGKSGTRYLTRERSSISPCQRFSYAVVFLSKKILYSFIPNPEKGKISAIRVVTLHCERLENRCKTVFILRNSDTVYYVHVDLYYIRSISSLYGDEALSAAAGERFCLVCIRSQDVAFHNNNNNNNMIYGPALRSRVVGSRTNICIPMSRGEPKRRDFQTRPASVII